jgi:hypothetical protein
MNDAKGNLMETRFKPRAPQVRCYKCGSADIAALCHHCWRPGCADHVVPAPRWTARLLGWEGAGQGLENAAAMHCKECGHAAVGQELALGVAGVAVAVAGLIAAFLTLAVGLALVVAGVLLAGGAYLTARHRAARRRAGLPLLLHPKVNDPRVTERLGVDITLVPDGRYKTSLRPVEGEISMDLVFGRPDRVRLDRYAGQHPGDRNTRFCAGCLTLLGRVDVEPRPDLPGPVRRLEGTTGAYPVFQAEDAPASSPWHIVLPYRLARQPTIKQGPVWVTPSLVPESDWRALELDIQWVELGPRDERLILDVIDLIQLRYPVAWGKVETASRRAIQAVTAEDYGGPEPQRSVEWRQLVPTEDERKARQLTLTIRFEGQIEREDQISGRLEATMKGALSGLVGVRLFSSLGRRRDDWRGASIRTRVEADFKLSLASIRYQDILIVPERDGKEDDSGTSRFCVIPDDGMVIKLTNALSKENYYVKRVIEHPPRSGGRADHVQRYWDIAGRRYEGVYPIDFHMVVTGEEIHRGDIRPEAGMTRVRIVVQGAYTDDEMKEHIEQACKDLCGLTRKTLNGLPSGRRGTSWSDSAQTASGQEHNASDPSRAGRRLLERLGKLDEALLDGRISAEQYEDMKARAERELGGWEA